jgi:hypothetical protein
VGPVLAAAAAVLGGAVDIRTARKKHWEDVPMDTLRKLAPAYGVKPRRLHKDELIHEMRMAYWDSQETDE